MFDIFYIGTKPNLFAHERSATSVEHAQELSRTRYFWVVDYLLDYTGFDFLYEPVPWQADYTHVWPSQHHEFSGTYLVPKTGSTTNYHFHNNVIPLKDDRTNFKVLHSNIDFDFTWKPHPHDPPYIYVFGNQWYPATQMATVEYHAPGATERKYIDKVKAQTRPSTQYWDNCTDAKHEFDYSWVPDPHDPPMTYVFGNQWWPAEKMPTLQWQHPDVDESSPVKYMYWPRATLLPTTEYWTIPDDVDASSVDKSWHPDPGSPPYIYQFGTQWQRTGGPTYTVPGATEIKYEPRPRVNKTTVDPYWSVPEGVDTSTFDWTWHPDATDPPYIYQFGTQHQRTGGPQYTVPGATETKYIEQIAIKTTSDSAVVVEIDHLDGNAGNVPNTIKTVRYFDNYRDTLIRIAKSLNGTHEFAWICSSICNYKDFDFSWHPEQWQATMLHVFYSDEQKFGDTFYMHLPTFAERAEKKALLEWYDVNFVDVTVPRRPIPVIQHNLDSQADAVKANDFKGPLALFTNTDYVTGDLVAVPLWRQEIKTITPLSAGASSVIVPKAARGSIKTQLYDYPYIDKTHRMLKDEPLDIVFIENGEPNADDNWMMLENRILLLEPNKLHKVSNVKGRAAAYHAAARASTTPWFFAVFGKLAIDLRFDWGWQPDRMQQAKHYIFHARNPVNGLEYGHQAMIAYNRELVLANPGVGLDFTLDSPHEVVPIISGTAYYNINPWTTWRTAFREVIKLKASLPDVEAEYRISRWVLPNFDETDRWSQLGALDAIEYYDEVGGDFDALKKSYEWEWLASYAFIKRGLAPI